MKMQLETHPHQPVADLQAEMDSLIGQIKATADAAQAAAIYDSRLFPLICESIRQQSAGISKAQLAFIPVGTQPYSPILAAIANPAERTVLIASPTSMDCAQTVCATLGLPTDGVRMIEEDPDPLAIFNIVQSEYTQVGMPDPAAVSIDVTSGRKATSASLGSIAVAMDFRQSYILADPIPGARGLSMPGKLIWLPPARLIFGTARRQIALELMAAGAYAAAISHFERLVETSALSADDRAMIQVCSALKTWLGGNPTRALATLERIKLVVNPQLETALAEMRDHLQKLPETKAIRVAEKDRETLAKGGGKPAKGGPVDAGVQFVSRLAEGTEA